MATERIPTAHVSFRVPYSAMDVYQDPASGKTYEADALDDATRTKFKRNRNLSQARYDTWLASFKQAAMTAMPSFSDVDERPRPGERTILEGKLFRVTVESENWCFAIRLSARTDTKARSIQAALFPKFALSLRDVLLVCGPSSSAVMKRNQTTFVPLSDVSDEDLTDMAKAARLRFSKKRGSVAGFNEPERPKKKRGRKAATETAQGGNP